ITFIPRFIAAFCVLKRVRRLGFKNTRPNVLCFPNDSFALGLAFSSKASFTISDRLSTSTTEKNLFIFQIKKSIPLTPEGGIIHFAPLLAVPRPRRGRGWGRNYLNRSSKAVKNLSAISLVIFSAGKIRITLGFASPVKILFLSNRSFLT